MTPPQHDNPWLHRFAALVAGATFLLVIAGGLVTSTGSGLAVPDWPLSFGQVFPRMRGGVLFEHGHRVVAAAVGALTLGLAVFLARREQRRWVRRLGYLAAGVVVLQGVLGGVTVLLRLPDAISVAHAGLAQLFFCIVTALALVTSPSWRGSEPLSPDRGAPSTRSLTLATTLVIYGQILIGAVVRHTGAGLAIPDFPLAFGRLVPPVASPLVAYQLAHRVGAVAVATLVLWAAGRALRRHQALAPLRRPALALVALLGFQIFLGALTIWSRKAVVPTTAHVATGALMLATSLVLALRSQRLLAPAATTAAAPAVHPGSLAQAGAR